MAGAAAFAHTDHFGMRLVVEAHRWLGFLYLVQNSYTWSFGRRAMYFAVTVSNEASC